MSPQFGRSNRSSRQTHVSFRFAVDANVGAGGADVEIEFFGDGGDEFDGRGGGGAGVGTDLDVGTRSSERGGDSIAVQGELPVAERSRRRRRRFVENCHVVIILLATIRIEIGRRKSGRERHDLDERIVPPPGENVHFREEGNGERVVLPYGKSSVLTERREEDPRRV